MIGKSLSQRHTLAPLKEEFAIAAMQDVIAKLAEPIVEVRSRDARMVACVVVRADEPAVRLCKALGFRITAGATMVFGLLGTDAARVLGEGGRIAGLTDARKAWLAEPSGPRETKVVLFAGGVAFGSVDADAGEVTVSVH